MITEPMEATTFLATRKMITAKITTPTITDTIRVIRTFMMLSLTAFSGSPAQAAPTTLWFASNKAI